MSTWFNDFGDPHRPQLHIVTLGALAAGGPKMKLQKRCIRRMFEDTGLVLDLDGVYAVALQEQ